MVGINQAFEVLNIDGYDSMTGFRRLHGMYRVFRVVVLWYPLKAFDPPKKINFRGRHAREREQMHFHGE